MKKPAVPQIFFFLGILAIYVFLISLYIERQNDKNKTQTTSQTSDAKDAKSAELPDYLNPPFVFIEKGTSPPFLRPELGTLYGKVYTNDAVGAQTTEVGTQIIVVFYTDNKDSKTVYAEWFTVEKDDRTPNATMKKARVVGYNYKNEKFVYDYERTIYQR